MKVSIFTPTHDTKYLKELYDSIKDQPFYEWVVVYNNGARPIDFKDKRVKSYELRFAPGYVGALKKYACEKSTGDILLEVDHDDLLMDGAVEEVKKAFKDQEIGFVYSNACQFKDNFKKVDRFAYAYGWKYRTINYKGHELDECLSFPPTPASVSRIWYAPDHLRAWRKSVYDKIGGHSEEMRVLDDLDLMCRTYAETKFFHIDKPLYLYRVTGENTYIKNNAEIQNNVMRIYNQYIERMALKDEGIKVDLGGRFSCPPGYQSVDLKNADITADLNDRWPFEDSSVSVVRAFDVFEHLTDRLHTMKELSRVLKPGGIAFIQVPSTDGRGAFQDPTHVSYWNENSFLYYTNHDWSHYIDTPVHFQALQLFTSEKNADQVCWVRADLINLKDNYRPPGLIHL